MLGTLEARRDDGTVAPLGRGKERALLAALLLSQNQAVSDDRLQQALWGERPPPSAGNALHVRVSKLRKLIGAERLIRESAGYLLVVRPGELDRDRFERLRTEGARALLDADYGRAAARLRTALDLWRGPVLADLSDQPFAAAEAERLTELRLLATEQRIEAELALGRHRQLVGELEALATEHPLREHVHAQLMLALYRCGRQPEALEHYRQSRQTLVDELGIDPSPELQDLERAILRQDPSLASPRSAAGVASPPPVPVNPIVGRQGELLAVGGLLGRGDVRLITLTGPGGVGKTRLALELAVGVSVEVSGPVCFVDLAAVGSAELVPTAIARAIGITAQSDRPTLDSLKEELRRVRLLLVLDNFEHLLDASCVVSELLAAAPRLTALVTSRTALRLLGEHEYPVGPLPLPPPRPRDAPALSRNEAVALFVTRAEAVDPAFGLTDTNAPAVAEIVRALDGLPLALELAAARTRLLDPVAMLGRLDSRLALLTGGVRDAPDRHRTLRATIRWSDELLDPAERRLFHELAVFAGGWTLESAAAVSDAEDIEGLVESLLAKSLVRKVAVVAGAARFGMLDTIREYALGELERSGRSVVVRHRCALHYLEIAERSEDALKGPDQQLWSQRVEAEHANLRGALTWLLSEAAGAEGRGLALRFATALTWFWHTHGHAREGGYWLERALEGSDGLPDVSVAKALHRHGIVLVQQGQPEAARDRMERALGAFRKVGDQTQAGNVLNSLATVAYARGDLHGARRMLEEVVALRRRDGDRRHISAQLSNLGAVLIAMGELNDARQSLEEALALDQELGDNWAVAVGTGLLALLSLEDGRPREAAVLQRESLEVLRDLGDRGSMCEGVERLSAIAAALGAARLAARLGGAAEAERESLGEPGYATDRALLERHLTPAREFLGAAAFASEWRDGRGLGFEAALDLALTSLA